MASRADGGESTGEGEEDDLLVGPLLGGVVVDGDTASSDLALLLGPGDVAVKGAIMLVDVLVIVYGDNSIWLRCCSGSTNNRKGGRRWGRGSEEGKECEEYSREGNVSGEAVTGVEARHCE